MMDITLKYRVGVEEVPARSLVNPDLGPEKAKKPMRD